MRPIHRLLTAALCIGLCALAGCAIKRTVGIGNPPAAFVPAAKAKFAYTGNQGGSLSGFSVKNSSGVLMPLKGFPLSTGANPTVVAADPKNRFLFVGDVAFRQLHVFIVAARELYCFGHRCKIQ